MVHGLAPSIVEVLRDTAMGGGERLASFESEAKASQAKYATVMDRVSWAIIKPDKVDEDGTVALVYDSESDAQSALESIRSASAKEHGDGWCAVGSSGDPILAFDGTPAISTTDQILCASEIELVGDGWIEKIIEWRVIHPDGSVLRDAYSEDDATSIQAQFSAAIVEQHRDQWWLVSAPNKETFDLAALARIDTSDPRIFGAWERLLGSIAETGGEVMRGIGHMVSSALNYTDIMRLFSLALLDGRTTITDPIGDTLAKPGVPHRLTDFKIIGDLFRSDPGAKWSLLGEALRATYQRTTDKQEDDA